MNNTNHEEQINNICNGIAESILEMPGEAVEQEFGTGDADDIRKVLLDAVEVERCKQIFDALDKAYDLVIEFYRRQDMNRDDFKRHFSGIADDYRMAKLRYKVARDGIQDL